MLYALTTTNQWQVAVLVDEAHNLVERGRSMYSAELNQLHFRSVKKHAPKVLKRRFDNLNREWNRLNRANNEADYSVQPELPYGFLHALQNAIVAVTDYLTEEPFALESALTQFYFDALHFQRVAELSPKHPLFAFREFGKYGT